MYFRYEDDSRYMQPSLLPVDQLTAALLNSPNNRRVEWSGSSAAGIHRPAFAVSGNLSCLVPTSCTVSVIPDHGSLMTRVNIGVNESNCVGTCIS